MAAAFPGTFSTFIHADWEISVRPYLVFPSRMIRLTTLLLGLLFASAAASAQEAAQPTSPDYEKYGLLRERDLTPFGFLRLDMRPAHAIWAPPGSWGIEVLLGYQNSWMLSPNVEQYLKSLPGRRSLGPADTEAIRALPGEAYLVDLELGLVDVNLNRQLTDHWSVNAIVSGVSYSGGFMDGTIEGFHKAFGYGSSGRPAVSRNSVNVILDLKNPAPSSLNSPRMVVCLIRRSVFATRWQRRPRPGTLYWKAR